MSAAGLILLNFFAQYVFARVGAPQLSPAGRLAVGALISETGILVPLVLLVVVGRLDLRKTFGLSRPPLWPTAFAVVSVVGGGVVLDEIMYLTVRLVPAFESPGLEVMGSTIAGAGLVGALALLPALAVGPAIVEEALCRGVVLRGLGHRFSPWVALLVSSAYFGALHFDRLHALVAFPMGLLLGFVALRTGSIWPAVACHFVNNVVSVVTPSLGGPSLPDVMARGHSWPVLAVASVALGAGLAGVMATSPRKLAEQERTSDAAASHG